MPTSVAIYARHSTDKQTHSTDDQIARCEDYCRNKGYTVFQTFRDEAVSGASVINRRGMFDLIDAATGGYFERVITEDLSRISRNQGDIAAFFAKLRFLDITLDSVAEGEVNELHIGFKGTMNALYLVDLADKTRRGMIASVLKGAIPGGKVYGYDRVHRFDDRHEPVKGLRRPNREQADVVKMIFEQYASGAQLQAICNTLNRQGIASPKEGIWGTTTLVGPKARKSGLLRQSLYKGEVTFNRTMYRKNPETGRRRSFIRPESDWIQVPVPELQIIDDKLFDRVQAMIEKRSTGHRQKRLLNSALADEGTPIKPRSRPTAKREAAPRKINLYLFSGKLRCADHNARMTTVHKRIYNCTIRPCIHRNIRHDILTVATLEALDRLSVDRIRAAMANMARIRDDLAVQVSAQEACLEDAREAIHNVLDAIATRKKTDETTAWLDDREANILKIRYRIENLKKQHKSFMAILDEDPENIVRLFMETVSPLHGNPDDQRVIVKVHDWFEQFVVKTENGRTTIAIDYDWSRVLAALKIEKAEQPAS